MIPNALVIHSVRRFDVFPMGRIILPPLLDLFDDLLLAANAAGPFYYSNNVKYVSANRTTPHVGRLGISNLGVVPAAIVVPEAIWP